MFLDWAVLGQNGSKKALLDATFGNFIVETRSVQKPDRGQIFARLRATALNPADGKIQKYSIFIDDFSAGELGEGVTDFKNDGSSVNGCQTALPPMIDNISSTVWLNKRLT